MSKERFTEVISNNLMRGIIIIIMFFKMYKELFFPKTEKKAKLGLDVFSEDVFMYFSPEDKAHPQFFKRYFKTRRFVLTAALLYSCKFFLNITFNP